MKIEGQVTKNIEKQDVNLPQTEEEAALLSVSNVPFSELINQGTGTISSDDIDYLSSLPVDYNFDSMSMNIEDGLLFISLAQGMPYTVENTQNGDFKNLMQVEVVQNSISTKTVETTNQIVSLIEKAQKTQKPVRISFDNDVSVVIKIDKHGKVTAEFIPGSLEVENYLKANMPALKQKFDEQNLPYNDLFYRQNNRQNNNKDKKGEK